MRSSNTGNGVTQEQSNISPPSISRPIRRSDGGTGTCSRKAEAEKQVLFKKIVLIKTAGGLYSRGVVNEVDGTRSSSGSGINND